MKKTLTLDDDVAAALERLREAGGKSLSGLANEALRRGIKEMGTRPKPRRPFKTKSVDLGRCALPSVDKIADALAKGEGEGFR